MRGVFCYQYFIYICIEMATTEKILFNIPKHIKDEFKETCDGLGMNMTNVLISMIIKFNSEAKQQPKK